MALLSPKSECLQLTVPAHQHPCLCAPHQPGFPDWLPHGEHQGVSAGLGKVKVRPDAATETKGLMEKHRINQKACEEFYFTQNKEPPGKRKSGPQRERTSPPLGGLSRNSAGNKCRRGWGPNGRHAKRRGHCGTQPGGSSNESTLSHKGPSEPTPRDIPKEGKLMSTKSAHKCSQRQDSQRPEGGDSASVHRGTKWVHETRSLLTMKRSSAVERNAPLTDTAVRMSPNM